jgi:LysR family transcriptional regulator, nitrogen assimilation regulatory protein
MDTEALRCFLRIAELGSFGKAAQALNVTQPTLSRRMRMLERELSAQLFARHQSGISLTPAGVALSKKALNIVRQLEGMHDEIELFDREPSGSVAVGLPPSLMGVLNGPLVAMYCERYPRVRLVIHEGINNLIEEKLVSGDIDVAIMFGTRSHKRYTTIKLLATEELVLANTKTKGRSDGYLKLDDVSELPLILYSRPNHIRWLVDAAFRQRGLLPRIAAEVDTLPMMIELARRNVGSVILPRSAVVLDVAAKRLVATRIRGMSVKWTLAVSREHERSHAVKALVACVEGLARKQIDSGKWAANWVATAATR